jgi:hypothetical protein
MTNSKQSLSVEDDTYIGDWWNRPTCEEILEEAIAKLKADFAYLRSRSPLEDNSNG